MNQFCKMKGILRQFSIARTPQQNGVAERRNRTLIEAAITMLADSKLPTIFWAEAINTACYVQKKVLMLKPHNKTPYELFHGKFDGKADECFFIGYSLNSKAFRVFNSRTKIVEENLHIRFSKSTPNGTQSNGFAGTKASDNAGQARKETEPVKDYILLPLWTADPPYSQDSKSSHDDGSKPSSDNGKKFNEDLRKDSEKDYNIFDFSRNDEDDGAEADMNNLDTTIQVSPIPTIRIHKDHPLDQEEPKKVILALKDPSWIEAMQEELLQFKLQEVWTLVDLPNGKIYVDDIIFGSTKKELCFAFEKLMHEKFQMTSIRELTFFLGLQVKQKKDVIFISQEKYVDEILKKFRFIKVKTTSTPMETQKPLLMDEDGEEVDIHMYRSMIGSLMYLTSSRPDIMFAVCACARYQVNLGVSHLHVVKRIFRYLKGQPKLGIWYPKDSPLDLVAYTDSDYARTSLDRKSTTGGC
ncbi:uncharacterized mitochondrial protein-like protein [Tanacetum coccineum]